MYIQHNITLETFLLNCNSRNFTLLHLDFVEKQNTNEKNTYDIYTMENKMELRDGRGVKKHLAKRKSKDLMS